MIAGVRLERLTARVGELPEASPEAPRRDRYQNSTVLVTIGNQGARSD